MDPSGAALAPVLFIYAVLAIVVVRRSVLMARGVAFGAARLVLTAVVFLLLFAFAALADVAVLPAWSLLLDAVAVIAGAAVAMPYVERTVRFERRGPDGWYYRLGLALPVAYLGLFFGRVVVEFVVLGIDPFAPSAASLDPLGVGELVAFTALFGFSAGLLVGRTLGVLRAHARLPPEDPGSVPGARPS